MTPFARLVHDCGMSLTGASRLLGVSYNTAKKWHTGARTCPERVIAQLTDAATAVNAVISPIARSEEK